MRTTTLSDWTELHLLLGNKKKKESVEVYANVPEKQSENTNIKYEYGEQVLRKDEQNKLQTLSKIYWKALGLLVTYHLFCNL